MESRREMTWKRHGMGKGRIRDSKRGNNRGEYEQRILYTRMKPLTGQSHTSSIHYSGF